MRMKFYMLSSEITKAVWGVGPRMAFCLLCERIWIHGQFICDVHVIFIENNKQKTTFFVKKTKTLCFYCNII